MFDIAAVIVIVNHLVWSGLLCWASVEQPAQTPMNCRKITFKASWPIFQSKLLFQRFPLVPGTQVEWGMAQSNSFNLAVHYFWLVISCAHWTVYSMSRARRKHSLIKFFKSWTLIFLSRNLGGSQAGVCQAAKASSQDGGNYHLSCSHNIIISLDETRIKDWTSGGRRVDGDGVLLPNGVLNVPNFVVVSINFCRFC